MSIKFGFFDNRDERPAHIEAAATARYAALTKTQQAFFHESLPPCLAAAGVGCILPCSLPVLAARLVRIDPVFAIRVARHKYGSSPSRELLQKAVEEYLAPFMGVVSNVAFVGDAEFDRNMRRGQPKFKNDVYRKQLGAQILSIPTGK